MVITIATSRKTIFSKSPPQIVTFTGTFSFGAVVDGVKFLSKFNLATTSNNNEQHGYLTIDKYGSLYLADHTTIGF